MRLTLRTVLPVSLAIAATLTGTSAVACSMMPGYKVPTNLELAVAADTIVVATVEDSRPGDSDWSGSVIARPTLLIKGPALPDSVEIRRAGLDDAMRRKATVSAPRELRAPNPDAMMGGCVRYFFTRGMKLVLFLKRDPTGALEPYRSAFSRDAEDVSSDDALWVKAVREYAAISVVPKEDRKRRLRQRIEELRVRTGDIDAIAIASDMNIELSGKRRPPYD
ncbi:hypothetical protein [Sphingomonas sp.]|uniref:hypothetical protein n=1 Tax=Sphingomonas sp. TaxID=28214 RepID=UPI002B91D4B3|nr:hypothetical protein [Sphingomonas sp.]HWK37040.1 hypothetical protein [Sphingomonas sp.]